MNNRPSFIDIDNEIQVSQEEEKETSPLLRGEADEDEAKVKKCITIIGAVTCAFSLISIPAAIKATEIILGTATVYGFSATTVALSVGTGIGIIGPCVGLTLFGCGLRETSSTRKSISSAYEEVAANGKEPSESKSSSFIGSCFPNRKTAEPTEENPKIAPTMTRSSGSSTD